MSATDFILIIIGILASLGIISVIVKKSRDYNMRIFLSKEYALLCLGTVFSVIAYFVVEPQESGALMSIGIGAVTFFGVLFLNIKKSTLLYGSVFTMFQTAMVACFVLIAFAIFHWITEKAR